MDFVKAGIFLSALIFWIRPECCFAASHLDFPNGSVEMIADRSAIVPGETILAGVHFRIAPGWHLYWKNPGDSGRPTRIEWVLPSSLTPREVQWPVPQRFVSGDLVGFGYENEVLITAAIEVPAVNSSLSLSHLAANVDWVLCNDECAPGKARLNLDLPLETHGRSEGSAAANLFESTEANAPRTQLSGTYIVREGKLNLSFNEHFDRPSGSLSFFPEQKGVFDLHTLPQIESESPFSISLSLRATGETVSRETALSGLLVFSKDGVPTRDYLVTAKQQIAQNGEGRVNLAGIISFGVILATALLGGLILNLMPCVFPIISLKVLGFMQSGDPRKAALHGWSFAAGVVVSFWVLAGVLFGLRDGGAQIGWGFQFQSPRFVAIMAYFIFGLALNIAGVFEIGGKVQTAAGKISTPSGFYGSFLNGVLATLLATPCSAPFMATAIAAAMVVGKLEGFLIFTAIGLGMSLPYILLPMFPAALGFLPRPGEWLIRFKQFLSFPLFATVCWLTSILSLQTSKPELSFFLFGLVPLAFGLWIYGQINSPQLSRRRRWCGTALTIVFILASLNCGLPLAEGISQKGEETAGDSGLHATGRIEGDKKSGLIDWKTYSKSTLQSSLDLGKTVLVNFTAGWCLTCQLNEHMAFASSDVAKELAQKSVVPLVADWTNNDPEIFSALKALGRVTVPVTVIFSPGKAPNVLPNLLTAKRLLSELAEIRSDSQ